MEINTGVIQLMHANPFSGMDYEDPINHLTKFYEIDERPGALDSAEENLYLRLFPQSLIERTKDWYLDQSFTILTNQNTLEDKFIK